MYRTSIPPGIDSFSGEIQGIGYRLRQGAEGIHSSNADVAVSSLCKWVPTPIVEAGLHDLGIHLRRCPLQNIGQSAEGGTLDFLIRFFSPTLPPVVQPTTHSGSA